MRSVHLKQTAHDQYTETAIGPAGWLFTSKLICEAAAVTLVVLVTISNTGHASTIL